jgi:hypothetical protein
MATSGLELAVVLDSGGIRMADPNSGTPKMDELAEPKMADPKTGGHEIG